MPKFSSDLDYFVTMDASRIFNEIIKQIENCQLNYVINKTPFSANISIKKSLIKWIDTPSKTETIVKAEQGDLPCVEKSELTEKLEMVLQEKERLEQLLNQETLKVKSCECDKEQLRVELLNVKKEKHASNTKLRTQNSEISNLKDEAVEMQQTIKDLENEVNEKKKALDVKYEMVGNLKKEKKESESKLTETLLQLSSIQDEKLLEKRKTLKKKCTCCDVKFASTVELNQHVRENQFKDQISQTVTQKVEILSELKNYRYPCFYCGFNIKSKENLQKHKVECSEPGLEFLDIVYRQTPFQHLQTSTSSYPPPFPWPVDFPCYTCDEKFENKIALRRHYDSSHTDIILFWCNVCFTNFGSERGLKSHERNFHKIFA